MRILHVVTGVQKASGITTFIENVTDELRKHGHHVDILTKSTLNAESLIFNSYDIIHLHGLWSPWLHAIAKKIKDLRCTTTTSDYNSHVPKLVWSPHGMLQKWALKNKWWKKLPALALYQWRDLHSADLLHATAQSEVEDIRRLGLRNRVVVVSLGVRIGGEVEKRGGGGQRKVKTLLFVSRVQRKKGLPNLIEAWSRLSKIEAKNEAKNEVEGEQRKRKFLTDGWQVRIVGPDEDNHVSELTVQCDRLGLAYQDLIHHCSTSTSSFDFTFTGPKYGDELAAEYAAADLFVLPTHSENFGSVVIEALAHGVPVITTKEAPWAELEEFKCGWWIDDTVEALTSVLMNVLEQSNNPNDLTIRQKMGACGRQLVQSRYTWLAVCDKILRSYDEVLR